MSRAHSLPGAPLSRLKTRVLKREGAGSRTMISWGREPSPEAQPPGVAGSSMSFSARHCPPRSEVYLITWAPLRGATRFRSCAGIGTGASQIAVHARIATLAAITARVRRSDLEAAQVLIAPPDAGERVRGLVVLDEVVPDAGL